MLSRTHCKGPFLAASASCTKACSIYQLTGWHTSPDDSSGSRRNVGCTMQANNQCVQGAPGALRHPLNPQYVCTVGQLNAIHTHTLDTAFSQWLHLVDRIAVLKALPGRLILGPQVSVDLLSCRTHCFAALPCPSSKLCRVRQRFLANIFLLCTFTSLFYTLLFSCFKTQH